MCQVTLKLCQVTLKLHITLLPIVANACIVYCILYTFHYFLSPFILLNMPHSLSTRTRLGLHFFSIFLSPKNFLFPGHIFPEKYFKSE